MSKRLKSNRGTRKNTVKTRNGNEEELRKKWTTEKSEKIKRKRKEKKKNENKKWEWNKITN